MPGISIPPPSQVVIDSESGRFTAPWRQYFDQLNEEVNNVGLRRIASGTIASGSTGLALTIPSGWSGVQLRIYNLIPATSGANCILRFSTDSSVSYTTAGYNWAHFTLADTTVSNEQGSGSDVGIRLEESIGGGPTQGINGAIELLNYNSTTAWKRVTFHTYAINNAATPAGLRAVGGGALESTNDIDALLVRFVSGTTEINISTGGYALYGVR